MIVIDLCNIPKEMSVEEFLEACLYAKKDVKDNISWYKYDTKEKLFYEYPMNGTPHSEIKKYISYKEADELSLLYAPVPSRHIEIEK